MVYGYLDADCVLHHAGVPDSLKAQLDREDTISAAVQVELLCERFRGVKTHEQIAAMCRDLVQSYIKD